jgi:hypothetical protein
MQMATWLAALSMPLAAAPLTYHKDIAPILGKRCIECHRHGEAAPMALTSYAEVRPWARAIREAVLSAKMPPWLADPRYGHFRNDPRLTEPEKSAIAQWVQAGAPEGDPKDAKPARPFVQGWNIGTPDLIFDIGEEFDVPASGVVPYKYFTVPSNLKEDVWIEAAEIRPDQRDVVHHVIVFMRGPNGAREGADTGADLLVGWAPGDPANIFEPGVAKLVKAGTVFRIQMHYTPSGTVRKDRTRFGLRLARAPVRRQIITGRAINTQFVIPAGAPAHEVRASWTAPADVLLHSFMPHLHLRGKAFRYTIVYPDGREQIALEVPKYDFGWQLGYQLAEPLALPAGTRIDCVAQYDNSPNNKANPDPTKDVRWGDQTWEEMMIGWLDFTRPVPAVTARQTRQER